MTAIAMTMIPRLREPLTRRRSLYLFAAAVGLVVLLQPEAAVSLDRSDCMRNPMFCEVEKNPDDVDLRLLRAAGYMARKEWNKAIEDYTAAIALDPDDPDLYFRRGRANDAAGNDFAASLDYQQALDLDPKRMDYALAVERSICSSTDSDRVLKMFPKSAEVYLVRALCHQRYDHMGILDLDKAEKDETRAIALKPDFAAAYYNRALLYVAKRNYKRALADLDSLERIDSGNAEVYTLRGVIRGAQGDLGAAVREHGKAIVADPLGAQRYLYRAWALLNAGQANAALADAGRAVMLNPANASTYETRGKIHQALGNKSAAELDFQTAKLPESMRVGLTKSSGGSPAAGGDGPNYTILIVLAGLAGLGYFMFRGRSAAKPPAPASPAPSVSEVPATGSPAPTASQPPAA